MLRRATGEGDHRGALSVAVTSAALAAVTLYRGQIPADESFFPSLDQRRENLRRGFGRDD